MATTKKGKKTGKAKKGSKTKKKSSMNVFSKIMLTLLLIAIFAGAIFLILGNFNYNETDKKEVQKQETFIKQDKKTPKEEPKSEAKKETKPEVKKETKAETKEVKKEEPKQETKANKETKESKKLNGCWLSNELGASLTMDDFGYRIDFFGVDASKPITGNYRFENNLMVFTNDSSDCEGIDGTYRITFYKKDMSLICIEDKCTKRKNILEADWEWIEL